jgi:hypothetical protein
VYHLMDIRLAKNIRLNMLGNSFFFANTYFQNPFFAFHDTTVSPTHRVMEPLRSRKCE